MKGRKTGYLYILSSAALALIVWSTILSLRQPNIGFFWEYSTGIVYQVNSSYPFAFQIQKGDKIISGDGHPAKEIYRQISDQSRKTIEVIIERDGKNIALQMPLLPPDAKLMVSRLTPLLIALAFCFGGGIFYSFSKVNNQNIQFFLFCQALAITLGAGAVSSFTQGWVKALFSLGLIWTGVSLVHLHTIFPTGTTFRYKGVLVKVVSIVAVILTIALLAKQLISPTPAYDQMLGMACLLYIGICFLIVLFLWSRSLFKANSAIERRQAGILAFFGILGFSPLVIFSIIPRLLMGVTLVPYTISMASLILIPVGYGYAIRRYKLGIDRRMHRGGTIALVLMVMAAFFVVSFSLEHIIIGDQIRFHPLWELVTTLLIAASSSVIYHRLIILTEKLLYGGWYDYRSVVHHVSSSLKAPGFDPLSIAKVICNTTGKSMQLDYAALFLYDGSYVSYEIGQDLRASQQPIEILDLLYEAVRESSVQISDEYRMRIDECMSNYGIQVDLREKVQFVVPLQGTRALLGVFILGNKIGHGLVTSADWEILESVTLQARIGIENARMIGELQEHSKTINQLHRQVVQAREEERKRVSRDLHDMVIQSLVGLNMQLEEMKLESEVVPTIDWETPQKETLRIVREARRICTDLRPASLDMFGLIPTIRSRIVDLEENAPFLIHLEVDGDEAQVIPEEIAVNLYRFFNESLINIQKHANADHVEIYIDLNPEEIKIQIEDNGDGFEVPERLDDLAKNQHFGLVGLQELLTMVGGKMKIHSTPGMGSSIMASVSLVGLDPRMDF